MEYMREYSLIPGLSSLSMSISMSKLSEYEVVIKDNLTNKLNDVHWFINSDDPFNKYLVNILASLVIVLISYIVITIYNINQSYLSIDTSRESIHSNSRNPDISNSIANSGINSIKITKQNKANIIVIKPVIPKPMSARKGLYIESLYEVLASVNSKDLRTNCVYSVLLRVRMSNNIYVSGKYNLHGNSHRNYSKTHDITRDMFMIFNLVYPDTKKDSEFNIVSDISSIMNFYNTMHNRNNDWKTEDFIVIAIGSNSNNILDSPYKDSQDKLDKENLDNDEFYNALIKNGYNLANYYDIRYPSINDSRIFKNFTLVLPIHELYDIFMDVNNNTIFESRLYVLDNYNYESWNDISINEINF